MKDEHQNIIKVENVIKRKCLNNFVIFAILKIMLLKLKFSCEL